MVPCSITPIPPALACRGEQLLLWFPAPKVGAAPVPRPLPSEMQHGAAQAPARPANSSRILRKWQFLKKSVLWAWFELERQASRCCPWQKHAELQDLTLQDITFLKGDSTAHSLVLGHPYFGSACIHMVPQASMWALSYLAIPLHAGTCTLTVSSTQFCHNFILSATRATPACSPWAELRFQHREPLVMNINCFNILLW